MSVSVLIPAAFQKITGNNEKIECTPGNILNIINQLEAIFPGIAEKLIEDKSIKKYINIYVNGKDIRSLLKENTIAKDGDEVIILPTISEG